ncbi:LPXTG cell wall anchor domain-containing protein [Paractinoplanes lichenicola]|uniref:LPXTG cell wall anchor domain-containing protein n=1 Tax=Paractinoplanes lichenicola TaxID=2802976 RepID=A0ABS1W2H3_9ACTN|nr:LPXTG cell wall anchor domain-containing protein [Actinoplanes lichenicola]MBL7260917.1 LPXTG cell wall anchor domain-containing protein [Actinoplanes lichenicola]
MRRLALPAALAAVALGGLAAPAQAAPEVPEPTVGVILPEQIAVIEGRTKTIRAEVINAGSTVAKNVVVNFGNVDKSLELSLPAGCDATSCQVGDLAPRATKVLTLKVGVTGDKLAATFEVATGAFETEVTVVRSAGGVDLEIEPIASLNLNRGQSAKLPVVVHNAGTEAVDSVGIVVLNEQGLTALGDYRNCLNLADIDDELGEETGVVCKFDETFEPGATFEVPAASPLSIKVNKDAGGPYTYGAAVLAIGVNDSDAALLAKKKSGKLLTLDALRKKSDVTDGDAPEDINEEDNSAFFGVTVGKSVADVSALGATADSEDVTLEVGLRNNGPTTLISGNDDFTWFPSVRVAVPANVELTDVDVNCVPGTDLTEWDFDTAGTVDGHVYTCFPELGAAVGETIKFAFAGTATGSGKGSVVVDGGVQDTNAANDKAEIVVTASGGQGGGLPVTGAPAGWVALGGAVLLLAGAGAAFLFRRRRIVTTL